MDEAHLGNGGGARKATLRRGHEHGARSRLILPFHARWGFRGGPGRQRLPAPGRRPRLLPDAGDVGKPGAARPLADLAGAQNVAFFRAFCVQELPRLAEALAPAEGIRRRLAALGAPPEAPVELHAVDRRDVKGLFSRCRAPACQQKEKARDGN